MGEERAWELFARAQGDLFERALEQVRSVSTPHQQLRTIQVSTLSFRSAVSIFLRVVQ